MAFDWLRGELPDVEVPACATSKRSRHMTSLVAFAIVFPLATALHYLAGWDHGGWKFFVYFMAVVMTPQLVALVVHDRRAERLADKASHADYRLCLGCAARLPLRNDEGACPACHAPFSAEATRAVWRVWIDAGCPTRRTQAR